MKNIPELVEESITWFGLITYSDRESIGRLIDRQRIRLGKTYYEQPE